VASGHERRHDAIERPHIVRKPVQQDHREAAGVPTFLITDPESLRIGEAGRGCGSLELRPALD
jgi:hypothetical protein